jgi:hypothetical protein
MLVFISTINVQSGKSYPIALYPISLSIEFMIGEQIIFRTKQTYFTKSLSYNEYPNQEDKKFR